MATFFAENDLGFWMLPKPPKMKQWERIPRLVKPVPWGYEIDLEDEEWLNPIIKEFSAWLTTQSGRSISHMGLKKRVDIERKRKTIARIKRELAKRLEKAISHYETLEKERTGYYT